MTIRLVLVDDGVPQRTLDLLIGAATRRALTTDVVRASHFNAAEAKPLSPGDLLYRPAVSAAASRVERVLFGPGVASFHADVDGPFFDVGDQTVLFTRAGLPTVPAVHCNTRRRASLERMIEHVGGFPMVAKVPGGEGGVGVVRLDSRPALFSFIDFALAHRHPVQLSAFVPDATHLRALVVGDHVVASYRNIVDADDFRSSPSRDIADYRVRLASELCAIAVAATRAIGSELGGVDLLLDRDGRPYVLEVNFPCYHAQAEVMAGAPVSDAMVQHLLDKRARLLRMSAFGVAA